MAKAIFLMDMPEQVCQKCTLCYETEDDEYMCCAAGKLLPDGEKPDWCPLRELPEKANHPAYCDNGRFDKGWNTCLDEILKDDGMRKEICRNHVAE
ncbi:MAG: hypothetical protein MR594_04755 [Lachnospiraceae bacterium]|nr:hypothetical protein [Lachnospiraceae bacterium]